MLESVKKVIPILQKTVSYSSKIGRFQTIHTSQCLDRSDLDKTRKTIPRREEGVQGEKMIDMHTKMEQSCSFPDESLSNLMVGKMLFKDIPILHIKATKNNTLMTITSAHVNPVYNKPNILAQRSCGVDKFKHTKKGTNVAAQTTGFNLGKIALEKGIDQVRVLVRGIGAGRMASVKGMEISGVKIVSITDNTIIPDPRMRARKARRV